MTVKNWIPRRHSRHERARVDLAAKALSLGAEVDYGYLYALASVLLRYSHGDERVLTRAGLPEPSRDEELAAIQWFAGWVERHQVLWFQSKDGRLVGRSENDQEQLTVEALRRAAGEARIASMARTGWKAVALAATVALFVSLALIVVLLVREPRVVQAVDNTATIEQLRTEVEQLRSMRAQDLIETNIARRRLTETINDLQRKLDH